MEALPPLIGMIATVAVWMLLVKPFFGKEKDFMECLLYTLTPDFLSWLDNDLQNDYAKSLKLICFLMLVFGAGFATWYIAGYFIK